MWPGAKAVELSWKKKKDIFSNQEWNHVVAKMCHHTSTQVDRRLPFLHCKWESVFHDLPGMDKAQPNESISSVSDEQLQDEALAQRVTWVVGYVFKWSLFHFKATVDFLWSAPMKTLKYRTELYWRTTTSFEIDSDTLVSPDYTLNYLLNIRWFVVVFFFFFLRAIYRHLWTSSFGV